MKPICGVIALLVLVTGSEAAETGTLTLACKGTTVAGYDGATPDPFSMSLMINFSTGTVQGFGTPGWGDIPAKVTGINEVLIAFGGSGRVVSSDWSISGTVDRVTGDVEATHYLTNTQTGKVYSTLCAHRLIATTDSD